MYAVLALKKAIISHSYAYSVSILLYLIAMYWYVLETKLVRVTHARKAEVAAIARLLFASTRIPKESEKTCTAIAHLYACLCCVLMAL